ncbi:MULTISPECIES: ABC transporter substrate-binding protein [Brucella]|jgi:putative hydroxymethylpyrimidine transport system substrate-binding protein|uniref:ABC transporter ATP-binding protein n=1 Tax=Brucella pseudogrignonensis TaxID=419475 RepID=A0A256GKC2_9HYPH|nr:MULTISPECIES: ABC transporter substrate-binding protein [Brucella]EMG55481.1 NMT1/THI5-like domain-containing protein [Ochrobactrum sp. CDB2]NNV21206.1 ABC transporter ATP-binding protein [Brucella pseudogrignonensis]OYR27380.1 NMT1/THI5 like family protein [Brucella pseudogrignonensis]
MKKLIFAALFSATASFALMSAQAAQAAQANDKFKLILDWYVNPDHGPIIVADKLGYFKDAGLDVEIIAPADASVPPKMVAAGQADLAISYQQQVHLDVHADIPLIRVGTLVDSPLNCLMVRDDGSVNSIADLKGKKIGFSVAGVEETVLGTILKNHDIKLSDVELINVNFSLAPSLMSKQVDAVMGAYRNVELNQMAVEGVVGKCFFVEEEGVPVYDELVYVANSNKLDANEKERISRFLAATEKAAQYIVNHPEQSYDLFASYSSELKDELNQRAWKDTVARFSRSPASLDYGRWSRYETYLKDNGLVPSNLPVERFAIDVNAGGDKS